MRIRQGRRWEAARNMLLYYKECELELAPLLTVSLGSLVSVGTDISNFIDDQWPHPGLEQGGEAGRQCPCRYFRRLGLLVAGPAVRDRQRCARLGDICNS